MKRRTTRTLLTAALLLAGTALVGRTVAVRAQDARTPDDEAQVEPPPGTDVGIDPELGLELTAPRGWTFERPGAAGERLRLVRRDGRAWCSLLVRALEVATPSTATLAGRVRATVAPEVPAGAVWRDADEDRVEVEHTWRASVVPRVLRSKITALPIEGRLVAVVRATCVDDGPDAPALRGEADVARRSLVRAKASYQTPRVKALIDRERRVCVLTGRDESLELAGEHPSALTTKGGARLEIGLVRDEPFAALARVLGRDASAIARIASTEGASVRARTDKARGVARVGSDGTLVAFLPAPETVGPAEAEALRRLAASFLLFDADRLDAQARRATDEGRRLARARDARAELRHDEAVALVASMLGAFPEDPEGLELRAALRREEGQTGQAELEAAYQAFAASWTAELLARTRLTEAEVFANARNVGSAAFRYAHVLELATFDGLQRQIEDFFASRDAKAQPFEVLPGLARVRELLPASTALKTVEQDLRLAAAKKHFEEGRFGRGRDELRRARQAGANPRTVDDAEAFGAKLEASKKKPAPKKAPEAPDEPDRMRRKDRRDLPPVAGFRPLS